MAESKSEERGLKLLTSEDLKVFSIGVSTAGVAEIRMAKANSNRRIIATTIDKEGLEFTKQKIDEEKLSDRIEVRLEDVSKPMPYADNEFDFVYARLVLHYLSKQDLDNALKEIKRVLKKDGKLFIILRELEEWHRGKKITFNPKTRMTKVFDPEYPHQRYFHTESTIKDHLEKVGFKISSLEKYDECLSPEFERKQMNEKPTPLIEVIAIS